MHKPIIYCQTDQWGHKIEGTEVEAIESESRDCFVMSEKDKKELDKIFEKIGKGEPCV